MGVETVRSNISSETKVDCNGFKIYTTCNLIGHTFWICTKLDCWQAFLFFLQEPLGMVMSTFSSNAIGLNLK